MNESSGYTQKSLLCLSAVFQQVKMMTLAVTAAAVESVPGPRWCSQRQTCHQDLIVFRVIMQCHKNMTLRVPLSKKKMTVTLSNNQAKPYLMQKSFFHAPRAGSNLMSQNRWLRPWGGKKEQDDLCWCTHTFVFVCACVIGLAAPSAYWWGFYLHPHTRQRLSLRNFQWAKSSSRRWYALIPYI